jgi:hypothetical protein
VSSRLSFSISTTSEGLAGSVVEFHCCIISALDYFLVPISFHFISSVVFNVKSLYIDAVFEDFDALWF